MENVVHKSSSIDRAFKMDIQRLGGVSGSSLNRNSLLHCNKVFNCQKKLENA